MHMEANVLPTDTPSTPGVRSKGQTIYFSKNCHAAYQIKGNEAQSYIKASMLFLHTPLSPEVGSKSHFFRKSENGHVALSI